MSNNKQTAVEWLVQELKKSTNYRGLQNIGITHQELFEQAKEMEKKQIMLGITKHLPIEDGVITAVQKAERYYNEEYGKQ